MIPILSGNSKDFCLNPSKILNYQGGSWTELKYAKGMEPAKSSTLCPMNNVDGKYTATLQFQIAELQL